MSATGLFPLRPSLQRGNISTNSVPTTLDVREKPLARSALGMSVHAASANVSLMNSPHLQLKDLAASSDMQRVGSADSHRTVKKKQSRKELREMQRSASAMSSTPPTPVQALPPPTSYSKHKYSRSWEEDADNDDARSICSFTCSFATEFDSKQKAKPCHPDEAHMKQRYLDAVFRKLTQKTGISRRESGGAWAIVDKKLTEERNRSKASQKARKVKPHFLDLSGLISPLPPMSPSSATSSASGGLSVSLPDTTDNVTPRPADFSRFQSREEAREEVRYEVPKMQTPPTLRARRSTEAFNEERRMQRDEWATTALESIHSAGNGEIVSGSTLGLTVGQVVPTGMSHVMVARAAAAASNAQQQQQPIHRPAPLGITPMSSHPNWPKDDNRTLHHQTGQRSIDMGRNKPSSSSGLRAIDMGRAASHDATPLLNNSPMRQTPTLRGVSGPIRGLASQDPHYYIPPSLQARSQGRVATAISSRGQTSPPAQGRAPTPLDDCISPRSAVPPPHLNRISTSSTASDSGTSSGISSVPQTPISRTIGLSTMQPMSMHMHRDDSDEQIELTADQEDHLLSGSGLYGLGGASKGNEYGRFAAPPVSMTPRPGQKRGQHAATLSEGQNALPPAAAMSSTTTPVRSARPHNGTHVKSSSGSIMTSSSSMESEDGMMTVRANRVQQRARANTLSSVQGPPSSIVAAAAAMPVRRVAALAPASPQSPSRTSSLQKKYRKDAKGPASPPTRDSMMSSHSTATTDSSSSSSSAGGGTQSLLSYTRGSPTHQFDDAPSPVHRSPSSNSRVYASASANGHNNNDHSKNEASPTKRTAASKAEDWASSIGRRFAKGTGIRRGSRDSGDIVASPLPSEALYRS